MPLNDFAQSLFGVAAAALLPGFALATLLAPHWRWWQRLAMSPGLSAGFIGVAGLAMHDAHIPFEPLTVLPLLAVLGAAAVYRWRRAYIDPAPAPPWWVPIPALIVGLVGAGVFIWALHAQVLPPDWDTATHGGLANTIARTHDVLPLIPIPLEASDFVRPRPGFEATAAVVSWLGGPSPAMSMAPIIAVTLVLIPLALTSLTLEATGSAALAAIVPFFALGLAFPSDQAIVGRFPEMVNSTLVVPFIVVVLAIFRGRRLVDNALLLFAIAASIWVIHGLEIFTALVVGCALLLVAAVQAIRKGLRQGLVRAAVAGGATGVGALLVTVLTRMPHVPTPIATEPSAVVLPVVSTPVNVHQVLGFIAQSDLISPITLALYVVGVIALLIRRRMLWVLVAQVVLVLLMVDDFYLHNLNSLWRLIYPWGESDRILGVQYWLIPLVLGAGFLAFTDVMRSLSRTRRRQVGISIAAVAVVIIAVAAHHPLGQLWTAMIGKFQFYTYPLGLFDPLSELRPWLVPVAVAVAAVVAAWLLMARPAPLPGFVHERLGSVVARLDAAGAVLGIIAVLCVVVGAASELRVYRYEVATRSLVTPADLTVLREMTTLLPAGTLVMTDGGDDAGMWLTGLTDLTPVVPNGLEFGTLSIPLYLRLADACIDPADAEAILGQLQVIFVGAQRIPDVMYPWNVGCIAKLHGLRLIASAPWHGTMAAAFEVTPGAG